MASRPARRHTGSTLLELPERVEAVDGTFVDLGQPGAGDGETLSGEAHAEIAQLVVDQLQQ